MFTVEIIIGAKLFSYLLGPEPLGVLLCSVGLSLIVLYYVLKGGFTAVVFTDGWQFRLLFTAYLLSAAAILYLLVSGQTPANLTSVISVFDPSNSPLEASFVVMFAINALVINSILPTTQISSWQRFNSASSLQEAKSGVWSGVFAIAVLWYIAIFTSAMVFAETEGIPGFSGMFDALRASGYFIPLFVFPLMFTGLIAALLSTADSFMISTMLAVEDLREAPGKEPVVEGRGSMLYTGLVLVGVAVLAALAASTSPDIEQLIVKLLFAAYGIPCILFALIAIGGVSDVSKNLNVKFAGASILAGLFVLVTTAYFGIFSDSLPATLGSSD